MKNTVGIHSYKRLTYGDGDSVDIYFQILFFRIPTSSCIHSTTQCDLETILVSSFISFTHSFYYSNKTALQVLFSFWIFYKFNLFSFSLSHSGSSLLLYLQAYTLFSKTIFECFFLSALASQKTNERREICITVLSALELFIIITIIKHITLGFLSPSISLYLFGIKL